MEKLNLCLLLLTLNLCLQLPYYGAAQLRKNYYSNTCPDVEGIVRNAVTKKFRQTSITAPATLRLFFHDCFVQGCDASIMIASTSSNKAEKDHPDNLSLAGDGFDTVIKAKMAVDAVPQCSNKVSCADILAMATRDVIALAGGPSYAVELGRVDGLSSTASSVDGKLPQPTFDLDQLTAVFAANGLSQKDMIALSAAHSVGFSHCSRFSNRIRNFSRTSPVDPTLNKAYANQLQAMCPVGVDPTVVVSMDLTTPGILDNEYYRNLQRGLGLLSSDQILFTDSRSRPAVDAWAASSPAFEKAFVEAMTKLGRVSLKTAGHRGNIRRDCAAFN